MCKLCDLSEITVAKLDDDEDSECEWYSEALGPGACSEPAVYAVAEWLVDD